jgi:hypothetical protein
LVGKANFRSYGREDLNCIYAAIVRGKFEAAADLKHGKNIRDQYALG